MAGKPTPCLPACHCHLSLKISMADSGSGTTRCRRPAKAQRHDEIKQQNITGQSLNCPGQKRWPYWRQGAHTDPPRRGNSMADPFTQTLSGITKQTQIVANLTVLYGLEMFLYLSFTHEIYDTLIYIEYTWPLLVTVWGKKYNYVFSVEIHLIEFRLLLPGQQGGSWKFVHVFDNRRHVHVENT